MSYIFEGLGQIVSYPGVTLKSGSSSIAVAQAQAALNIHGAILIIDGIFGPKTLAAVKTFQQANSLKVDGIIGSATWNKLFALTADEKAQIDKAVASYQKVSVQAEVPPITPPIVEAGIIGKLGFLIGLSAIGAGIYFLLGEKKTGKGGVARRKKHRRR